MQSAAGPNDLDPARLKELREAKQRCARKFGDAKRQGLDLGPLKAEMQAITQEIDRLETLQQKPTEPMVQTPEAGPQARILPARFGYQPPELPAPTGLRIAPTQDPKAWDAYADAHPASTPYHFEAWRVLVCQVMGHSDVSLEARDEEGRIVGILPLIHMRSLLFGKFMSGLVTLAVVLAALWIFVTGLGILMLGVPPGTNEVVRGFAFLIAAIAYGAVWLALAMLFSIVFRSSATAALGRRKTSPPITAACDPAEAQETRHLRR